MFVYPHDHLANWNSNLLLLPASQVSFIMHDASLGKDKIFKFHVLNTYMNMYCFCTDEKRKFLCQKVKWEIIPINLLLIMSKWSIWLKLIKMKNFKKWSACIHICIKIIYFQHCKAQVSGFLFWGFSLPSWLK